MSNMHAFITVKYGDNQKLVLNPWCPVYILLESIRRRCGIENGSVVDLVDLEGNVLNLPNRLREYASTFTQARQILILIRVEAPDQEGMVAKYVPLLDDMDSEHPELSEKLNNLNRPPPPPSRNMKRTPSRMNLNSRGRQSGKTQRTKSKNNNS